jgi:hypothetical protein
MHASCLILILDVWLNRLQYLCVYKGSVADDAHWSPDTYLKYPVERDLIRRWGGLPRRGQRTQTLTSSVQLNNSLHVVLFWFLLTQVGPESKLRASRPGSPIRYQQAVAERMGG